MAAVSVPKNKQYEQIPGEIPSVHFIRLKQTTLKCRYQVPTSGCGLSKFCIFHEVLLYILSVTAFKRELLTVLYLSKSADLRKTEDPFVSNLVKRAESSGESTLSSTAAQNRLQ